MKTRNGFVSNSSSSSFIIIFPKKPKTREELRTMFFGKNPPSSFAHLYSDDEVYSCDDVVDSLWTEIKGKKSATVKEIAEQLACRYHFWEPENCCYDITGNKCEGWGYVEKEPFFGVDKTLLKEMEDLYLARYESNKKWRKEGTKLKIKFFSEKYGIKLDENGSCLEMNWQDFRDLYNKSKFEDSVEYKTYEKKRYGESDGFYNKICILTRKSAEIDAQSIKKHLKGSFIAIVSYSDNDGPFNSFMEHGDHWNKSKLTIVGISQH